MLQIAAYTAPRFFALKYYCVSINSYPIMTAGTCILGCGWKAEYPGITRKLRIDSSRAPDRSRISGALECLNSKDEVASPVVARFSLCDTAPNKGTGERHRRGPGHSIHHLRAERRRRQRHRWEPGPGLQGLVLQPNPAPVSALVESGSTGTPPHLRGQHHRRQPQVPEAARRRDPHRGLAGEQREQQHSLCKNHLHPLG